MHALDNPFWSSLRTRHAGIARLADGVARYPVEYAPFLGVADGGADARHGLESLVEPGESVYLLGVTPPAIDGWRLEPLGELSQMVLDAPLDELDGPDVVALTPAHRADVLELVALVYPHYFRERTMELGRYFGIFEDGRLATMIGERLGTPDATEMSAICTHPAHTGRGLARRLMARLANDLFAAGQQPFLHVAQHNARAIALYQRVGFRQRRTIPFFALHRPPA